MTHCKKMRMVKRRTKRSRAMRGRGIFDWVKKAANFVKRHKLISRGANAFGKSGSKYAPIGTAVGSIASQLGLGRRRRRRGGALRLAGMGLSTTGGRMSRMRGRRGIMY
jgi:hypothetical protein